MPSWRCPVYRWRELVAGAGMEQENLSFRYRRPVEMGEVAPWSREEEPQVADTARGRVPMRSTGADRPIVATMTL